MAPTAARRAKPVQRSSCQGLPGNPDACRPRRGVVGPSYGSFASGQARKLIPSAGPPLPTEPASLGFGGGPSYRKRQPMGRAAMHARFLPASHNPPPPWAPGPGSKAPGAPSMKIHAKPPQKTQALVVFPPLLTAKAVPRPGRPAPAQARSRGPPRQVDGAPRSSRPTGWWIRRQAGDHRSPLRKQHRVAAGAPLDGWMVSAPTSSAQAADRSLRRKRQSSFPPLCLLSPRRPLRWVAAGTPWNGPSGCHTPRRRRVKDAAPYLP